MLVAFHVGFRMPSLWTLNYYIPSFFDGFWRRSLIGTLLYPFGELRFGYYFIAAMQAAVLLAVLYVLVRQALKADLGTKAIVIVLLLGPFGGFLFDDIGYAEQPLYLMLLAALLVPKPWGGLAIMAATLFVHEMAAFTVVPIYIAALVVRGDALRGVVLRGLVLVAVFCAIYLVGQLAAPADIEALTAKISAHGDYQVRTDYYDVFREQFLGQRQKNFLGNQLFLESIAAVAFSALTAAAFVGRGVSLRDVMVAACVFAAGVAPFLLALFAWDATRWVFLSFCSTLTMVLLFAKRAPERIVLATLFVLLVFAVQGKFDYFYGNEPRRLASPNVPHFITKILPTLLRTIPGF